MLMKFIKEFKEFAIKGNMIEMAVGIVIGASFNSVVNVLVKNVLLPPLSLLSEGVNFQEKKIILRKGRSDISEVSIELSLTSSDFLFSVLKNFTIINIVKPTIKKSTRVLINKP